LTGRRTILPGHLGSGDVSTPTLALTAQTPALLTLDPGESIEVIALCEDFLAHCPIMSDRGFILAAGVFAQSLPRRLRQFVSEARRQTDWGYFQIRCAELVEQNALGDTPANIDPHSGRHTLPEALLVLIGGLLGDIFGWHTQQGGRLIHDIVPIAGSERGQTSACSERELSLHTEDAFHPYSADYVGLCCLRNRERAGTTLSNIKDIVLDANACEILFQPRFQFIPDASHDVDGGRTADRFRMGAARVAHEARPTSVLFGASDAPGLRLDPDYITSIPGDFEAQGALDALCRALEGAKTEIVSRPGDYLFLDNQRVVHGRSPFHAKYDGRQRWFKRVNIARDLARMADAGVSVSRPIVQ
jgi:Fe(II)/alpha-ketoglutarate-dependent arginine beta-hydroxylase